MGEGGTNGRDRFWAKLRQNIAMKLFITNEDPYDENPMEIVEQVAKETKGKANKILDRREAINRLCELLNLAM